MKLVLTSDWQCSFGNLSDCEHSLAELKRLIKDFGPDAVIHAGDLKENFNPEDLRVVKFWIRAIRDLAPVRLIILKGNHDALAQSAKAGHWLDILRSAGAEIVTQPKWKAVGNGRIAFLPHTNDKRLELQWAKELANGSTLHHDPSGAPQVLLFHTDVEGASMGQLAGRGITPEQILCRDDGEIAYSIALGGHYHEFQKVGKYPLWFIGSPFCQTWGEVNQRKGHVTWDSADKKPIQHPTSLVGWYDMEWLEERRKNCKRCGGSGYVDCAYVADDNGIVNEGETAPCECMPEEGALIRSRVAVTTKKITEQLSAETQRMHKAFPGARTLVIPKLIAEKAEIELTGSTDKERIEQYVAATMPEAARFNAALAVRYIDRILSGVAGNATAKAIRFISLKGENVLSFPKIDIRYDKQGLVLLKGINKDWQDGGGSKSNGAGKTSALSLLPIAISGQTPRGQKHDRWAREHTKKPAWLELVVRDDRKRRIRIKRGRRMTGGKPAQLQMWIGDEEVSTGMRGVGRNETQGQLEKELGYNLVTLMNSVYIDQTIANGFLFGTQKTKMDLIGKIEDLTRYEAAGKTVSAEIGQRAAQAAQLEREVNDLRNEIAGLRDDLKEAKTEQTEKSVWLRDAKQANKLVKANLDAFQQVKATETFYAERQKEATDLEHDIQEIGRKYDLLKTQAHVTERENETFIRLQKKGRCGTCGQKVPEQKEKLTSLESSLQSLAKTMGELDSSRSKKRKKLFVLEEQIADFEKALEKAESELAASREKLIWCKTGEKREREAREQIQQKRLKLRTQLRQTKVNLEARETLLTKKNVSLEMRYYAAKAFHRSGIALYLCSNLCESLNRYAEEYSGIFWDGRIKVMFSVEDAELTAKVVNPSGSRRTNSQSVGESAMAGLVTAFALREAGRPSNLLIVDEPGTGLDIDGQKQLALGMLRLDESGRFSTILVTTHSPIIQGILEGKKIWRVVKTNRRSRLITGSN